MSNDYIRSHHRRANSPLSRMLQAGGENLPLQYAKERLAARGTSPPSSESSSVILEQAWIMKMAGEIARRIYDEKQRRIGSCETWEDSNDRPPPPAYEVAN